MMSERSQRAPSVNSEASRATHRSNASGKYRTVSKTSQVDDALFGNTGGTSARVTPSRGNVINKKMLSKAANLAVETDATYIDRSDLDRIKANATVMTREDEENRKKREKQARDERQALSKARKDKMLKMEEERKKNAPLTDLEEEAMANKDSLHSRAKQQMDEELDDVKHMNQMMLYSKCVTIRDAQLMEKQILDRERREAEMKMDIMMEQERLKSLHVYEERDRKRFENRQIGAKVLKQQIEERERERVIEKELQDQEREAMLRQMDILKQQEQEQAAMRKEAGRRLLEEASAANAEQIRRKQKAVESEIEEDRRVADYLRDKDMRELAQAEEAERIRVEKEKETARLRAMQEKVADKQAELDALRAKRAMESYEREWRGKEKAAAERQALTNKQIAIAREQQKMEKERTQAEAARQEMEEFERILQVQRNSEAADRERVAAERALRLQHADELRNQIIDNEERARRDRQVFLEEGNKLRHQRAQERGHLADIKARKLHELRSQGVPDKYLAELEAKRFT